MTIFVQLCYLHLAHFLVKADTLVIIAYWASLTQDSKYEWLSAEKTQNSDPSVQRLIEQTSRDLNNHYKQLSDHEKKCLRRHADKNLIKLSINRDLKKSR